jgi:cytochrome c-type protein NapB
MPDVAKSVGATPIPPSHFTDFRPTTVMKNGQEVKGGKVVGLAKGDLGNVGDIKLAKPKKLKTLYAGRYNCSQCHVPQANLKTPVDNTFKADFSKNAAAKTKSNLIDVMNEGVQ